MSGSLTLKFPGRNVPSLAQRAAKKNIGKLVVCCNLGCAWA